MADLLGMDPGRIERLRSPDRLEYFDPAKIWQVLRPKPDCTVIEIGAGVGFVTLPFAKAYPGATVYGCDILEGMVGLLAEDAAAQGLANLEAKLMAPMPLICPTAAATLSSWHNCTMNWTTLKASWWNATDSCHRAAPLPLSIGRTRITAAAPPRAAGCPRPRFAAI